ncbi:MAG TPA: MMPL family transporter, partial [Longimicrobiales bacterium]|nr:MMPL family transporter [Longimicrobiales bacterium]
MSPPPRGPHGGGPGGPPPEGSPGRESPPGPGGAEAGRSRRRLADAVLALPTRRPWTLIVVSLVLALAGAWVYFFELEIVSTRGALTDPDAPFNRRWTEYQERFGGERDFMVLVLAAPSVEGDSLPPEPDPATRAAMKGVAERWAEALRERPDLFPEVTHRIEPSALGDHALLYLPVETLDRLAEGLGRLLPRADTVAGDPRASVALGQLRQLVSSIEPPDDSGEGQDGGVDRAVLRSLLETMEAGFAAFRARLEEDEEDGALPDAGALLGAIGPGELDPEGYLFVGDGRLLTVLADTREEDARSNRYASAMAWARAALDSALAPVPDSVEVEAGLTGEPALEHEEMIASQGDFARSTVLAFVLVSLLFMWAFRSVLRPGLAAICLGMSVAITFLVAWLAIGHLNVLAMVFAVILVALGIDFALHFYTHYRRFLAGGEGPIGAIGHTY